MKNDEVIKRVLRVVEDMQVAATNRRNVGERSTAAHLSKWASKVKSAVLSK